MTDNGSPIDANASAPATELPDKMRVHALARLLGGTSRDVLDHLEALGSDVRSASATIDREIAQRVVDRIGGSLEESAETTGESAAATSTASVSTALFSAAGAATDVPIEPAGAASANPLFLPPGTASPAGARATSPAASADEATADDGDEPTTTEGDESDEAPSRSRRRRRGRRGRGRGEAGAEGTGDKDSDDEAKGDSAKSDEAKGEDADDKPAADDTEQASDADADAEIR